METKGFIHIYDCEDELVNDFKSFCENHSCNRYNAGLKFLLEFHKTFSSVIKKEEIPQNKVIKTFGGNSIKLNEDEKK